MPLLEESPRHGVSLEDPLPTDHCAGILGRGNWQSTLAGEYCVATNIHLQVVPGELPHQHLEDLAGSD